MHILNPNYKNNAIEYARIVRRKRSEIKSDLKDGKLTPQDLFRDKEIFNEYIANMKVVEFMCAIPGFGRVKAEKVLKEMEISPCKKLGGLGKKQKKNFYNYFKISF